MLYIAYGSNMNIDQMAYRCPGSKVVCKGMLYGWKLVFNVHADIIPTSNDEDTVPVLVWKIAPEDWKRLDMYEGYPKYYVKQEIETWLETGVMEKCVAYVMADNRKGYQPPNHSYFEIIIQGCEENGIDVDYLYRALDEAWSNGAATFGIKR